MGKDAEIYSGKNGAVFVTGDTKKTIIHLLEGGEKTEEELVKKSDKARSTISVHLSDLKEMGLVEERHDPQDARKKIFSLSAKLIGGPEYPYKDQYYELLNNLKESSGSPYTFLKGLFHIIRYGLISQGLDVQPALKEIGREAGITLSTLFESSSKEKLLEEISDFWSANGLGEVKVLSNDTILVKDCFDCGGIPAVDETLCSLDEGLLEGIVEGALGIKTKITEEECYGTGHKGCVFKLEVI